METPFFSGQNLLTTIGDFFTYIRNAVLAGTFNVSSGSTDYANFFQGVGSWIVTIMTILFIVFVVWAIYIRIRVYEVDEILDGDYKAHFVKPEIKLEKTNVRWQNILNHFASKNPNDWRAAIMDADVMLEELVTSLGYTGEGLGAKLTSIRLNDFPTLQSAWEAHKIRNVIAHEGSNYNLTERQKEVARRHFEAVFKDAGII